MKTILFFYQLKNDLKEIKQLLQPYLSEWEIHFCNSSTATLTLLAQKNIDVFVSYTEKLDSSGVHFLETIRASHPNVIRISIVGQLSEALAAKNALVCHQQLPKTSEPEVLISTLKNAIDLKGILKNQNLATIISNIRVLPSLPTAYQELIMELNSGDTSLDKVSVIMASDIGMSSKVLKLVNSAFFALPRKISNAEEATRYLGVDVIKGLVLSIGLFSQLKIDSQVHLDVEALHAEGVEISKICRSLLTHYSFDRLQFEYAQIASLLMNIGRLILFSKMPFESHKIQQLIEIQGCSLYEAEQQTLGCTNTEIAAYLLALWGLPNEIVHAVHKFSSPVVNQQVTPDATTLLHLAYAVYQHNKHNIDVYDLVDIHYLEQLEMLSIFDSLWQKLSDHTPLATDI